MDRGGGFFSPSKKDKMQEIKIRYIGKSDSVVTEYNGKKYTFSRNNQVQIIPLIVYNFLQDNTNPFREDIIPHRDDKEEKKEEIKKTITQEIDEIEKEIITIKKEEVPNVSKTRGRPRK